MTRVNKTVKNICPQFKMSHKSEATCTFCLYLPKIITFPSRHPAMSWVPSSLNAMQMTCEGEGTTHYGLKSNKWHKQKERETSVKANWLVLSLWIFSSQYHQLSHVLQVYQSHHRSLPELNMTLQKLTLNCRVLHRAA